MKDYVCRKNFNIIVENEKYKNLFFNINTEIIDIDTDFIFLEFKNNKYIYRSFCKIILQKNELTGTIFSELEKKIQEDDLLLFHNGLKKIIISNEYSYSDICKFKKELNSES